MSSHIAVKASILQPEAMYFLWRRTWKFI